MIWRKKARIDPVEVSRIADEASEQIRSQQPHVDALNGWLERRKNINGFGQDFELTLIPKGSR